MKRIPEYVAIKQESLTPSEFIQILERDRDTIAHSRFIPPRLGEEGFGKFRVSYRHSILRRRYGK